MFGSYNCPIKVNGTVQSYVIIIKNPFVQDTLIRPDKTRLLVTIVDSLKPIKGKHEREKKEGKRGRENRVMGLQRVKLTYSFRFIFHGLFFFFLHPTDLRVYSFCVSCMRITPIDGESPGEFDVHSK